MSSFKEMLINLHEKYEKVRKTLDVDSANDPATEPYRSKYLAKDILFEMKRELNKISNFECRAHEQRVKIIEAAVNYYLGLIYVGTEEISTGEEHLNKCWTAIEDVQATQECVILAILCLNELGVLWSTTMRDQPQKSKEYLEKAEQLYKNYKTNVGKPPYDVKNLLAEMQTVDEQPLSEEMEVALLANFTILEKAITHTLYYLAQVYTTMGNVEKSALYCHTTLKRQLEFGDYDPVDWALNAATLSQYYVGKNRFYDARHHLACATRMLDKYESGLAEREPPAGDDKWENLRHRRADVDRCWVKYSIVLLTLSKDWLMHQEDLEEGQEGAGAVPPPAEKGDHGDESGEDLDDEMAGFVADKLAISGDGKSNVMFKSLESTSIEDQVRCEKVLDFDDARHIFLHGQKHVANAKEYYTLTEHASDFVEITQDMSKLYRFLAFFEPSEERVCKMQKRRLDLLEPVLKELNPRFYLHVCRQLQFELAEIYSDMMDIKQKKLSDIDIQNANRTVKKINHLIEQGIHFYRAFLDTMLVEDKMPEVFPEDLLRPALLANFSIARLHSKIVTIDKAKQIDNLKKSIDIYEFIIRYCDEHPEAKAEVSEALALSREMLKLLPLKMNKIINS